MASTSTIGLRFKRTDEPTLRTIAHRIRTGDFSSREERGKAVDLFAKAAQCAATGEPLIVHCQDPIEAVAIADGFPRWGVSRPAVEELAS